MCLKERSKFMIELFKAEPRIMIAIPSLDYVSSMFVEALTKLQKEALSTGLDVTIEYDRGTLVHLAREHLAKRAVEDKYTHVLWLDADMIFPPTTLNDLLQRNESFITGIYCQRRSPFDYVLFKDSKTWDRVTEIPDEPFEIAGCGFGCVLTATKILEESLELFNTCFKPIAGLGEDLCFCRRVSDLHYTMFADPRIRCGHISQSIITS